MALMITKLTLAALMLSLLSAKCTASSLSGTNEQDAESLRVLKSAGLTGDDLQRAARAMSAWVVETRRELHQNPELMYDLNVTTSIVRRLLNELAIPFEFPVGKAGIVGHVGSGLPPVVALRSDMDALPVHEIPDDETRVFASLTPGRMHACGHDGHMSMLLAAAKLLKEREGMLTGTVKLVFQPAEEGGAGGLAMALDGVLEKPHPVSMMFGMHLWPWIPSGTFALKEGPMLAAAGTFEVAVRGKGGHAAAGIGVDVVDPVVAASAIVTQLQSIVSREVHPNEQAIVSVTRINGGDAYNVIPNEVVIGGTLRAFSRDVYNLIERRTKEIMEFTARAHGCTVELRFTSFADDCLAAKGLPAAFASGCTYPPVVNDDDAVRLAREVAKTVVEQDRVLEAKATMGGEDFAYFAERIPSAFIYIGIGNETKRTTAGLHSPNFKIDESALPLGAALHASLAVRALAERGGIKDLSKADL
uniref:Peptidase M20 dimerisation domain-containing protein n=1 Tax=Hanusia phi TaxID=3032 RepID=A0A7S0H9Z4_9CRYP